MRKDNPFHKGHKLATGRPKGSKNRLTNDVRQAFHKVYDEMGQHVINPETGNPLSGHEAFLIWARDNQTEFYRLYGKMIPQTAEIGGDSLEDFLDELVLEEDGKLLEASATVVDVTEMGKDDEKQGDNGVDQPQIEGDNAPDEEDSPDLA